jgi:predicted nucleic acid-binding protein
MHKAIISDTSCLILLEKIGEIGLLRKLFGQILTTPEVAKEFGLPLPNWVSVEDAKDKNYQAIIEASVDRGEASAIALAIETEGCLLILDDLKARNFAKQLGITITGTLGIILDAKLSGHIPIVKPILNKIKATNFRLSENLEKFILAKAGEE